MRRDFTLRRRIILTGVTFLVLADAALAVYSWDLSNAAHTPQKQIAVENMQHELLRADIKRTQDIRNKIPAIQRKRRYLVSIHIEADFTRRGL